MAKKPKETTMTETTSAVANTRSITINGLIFKIENKYAEGHVLTAAEAGALNQTRAEGLRNNFSKEVKKVVDALAAGTSASPEAIAELQSKLDTYASGYEFSMGGGRSSDPIQAEAKSIASEILDAKLRAAGIKKGDYQADGRYDAKLAEIIALPAVQAKAVETVEGRLNLAQNFSLS